MSKEQKRAFFTIFEGVDVYWFVAAEGEVDPATVIYHGHLQ
ncbi:hypothetical protein [Delftia acidovorans]|jgi:hypothetical protein|nr:hypothetical protein [Delftia acidovorans]